MAGSIALRIPANMQRSYFSQWEESWRGSANGYRPDLEENGIGKGDHAFSLTFERNITAEDFRGCLETAARVEWHPLNPRVLMLEPSMWTAETRVEHDREDLRYQATLPTRSGR